MIYSGVFQVAFLELWAVRTNGSYRKIRLILSSNLVSNLRQIDLEIPGGEHKGMNPEAGFR